MTKGWLEAFSDDVITTITKLVIDLPEGDDLNPRGALRRLSAADGA